MHDQDIRSTVLLLAAKGHSSRKIAGDLGISRHSVKTIVAAGTPTVPKTVRPSSLAQFHDELLELHRVSRGNIVRVHEQFVARHGDIGSYTTVTRYLRGVDIGKKAKAPAGQYHFVPGEEMQHDTSPHQVLLGDKQRVLQCASVVLCHSRMIYVQVFEQFTRLQARIFLTEAMVFFGGAATRCVVDNTSVIRQSGVGAHMVPAPEMMAFGKRFGFVWLAHELNDPNRKGRVERRFLLIEHNFYPGRTFASLRDCNEQLRVWCDQINGKFRRYLRAKPIELFASEQAHLQPLPLHVPEQYGGNLRIVDQSAFVNLHTNRYSVPADRMGRQVEVREYKERVRIFEGSRLLAEHPLLPFGQGSRSHLPEHRVHGMPRKQQRTQPCDAELKLRKDSDGAIAGYLDRLREQKPGRAVHAMRQMERIWREYPHDCVLAAVQAAQAYGMFDLPRLERMVLRQTGGNLFGLPLFEGLDDPAHRKETPDDN